MSTGDKENPNENLTEKPKIALVADIKDWAFSNIAVQIKKNLSEKYHFEIFYIADYEGGKNYERIFIDLFCGDFDLVHFFWRGAILEIYAYLKDLQNFWDKNSAEYIGKFIKIPTTFSIYDHCFLEEEVIESREVLFNCLANGYTVSSEKLFNIYQSIDRYVEPNMVIEDGVDLDLFFPNNLERLLESGRDIVIGWAGNSTWWNQDGIDHKGLITIIKPVIESLRNESISVKGDFADRSERLIPLEAMVDYYNSIDIYVCASDIEGTPNPVLEAMACGVPVLSTDVGIVPQLFGSLQSKYMVRERIVEVFKEKIRELATDPDKRWALSKENLDQIKGWTREEESKKWDRFFKEMLTPSTPENNKEPEFKISEIDSVVLPRRIPKKTLFKAHKKVGRARRLQVKIKRLTKRLFFG